MDVKVNLDSLKNEMFNEVESIVTNSCAVAGEQIVESLHQAYDDIVEDYYEYQTKSYYRHNAGVGTGWGDNLYYSNHIEYKGNNIIAFNINEDGMAGYKKVSSGYVLDNMLEGHRGLPAPWRGHCDDFSTTITVNNTPFSGTPNAILDQLEREAPNLYKIFLTKAVYAEINTGKYTFFKNKKGFVIK